MLVLREFSTAFRFMCLIGVNRLRALGPSLALSTYRVISYIDIDVGENQRQ